MLQDLFRFSIFGKEIAIHGFGLMMVIGFLGAMYLSKYLARRSGIDGEAMANACLIGLFAGVIGARLSHVLENLSEFTRSDRTVLQNLLEVVNIGSGGLTYYGGFLLAFPTLVLYALWKTIPLRTGMDIVAPCLMIGLGFGRIGCFLNGCCYGAQCDLSWAVQFPYGSYAYEDQFRRGQLNPPPELQTRSTDGYRMIYPKQELQKAKNPLLLKLAGEQRSLPLHPAQLYSALTAFLLAAMLIAYFTLPHTPGMGFALMMTLEGIARFVLEILRVEPAVAHLGNVGFSLSMLLGIGLAMFGIILAWVFNRIGAVPKPNGFAGVTG